MLPIARKSKQYLITAPVIFSALWKTSRLLTIKLIVPEINLATIKLIRMSALTEYVIANIIKSMTLAKIDEKENRIRRK